MGKLDDSYYKITKPVYLDMYKRWKQWKTSKGKEPEIIYIQKGGKDYITNKKFTDVRARFDTWWKANKKQPNYVYINKPLNPIKGKIQLGVEAKLGAFNTISKFYNKMLGRGYGNYYNDIKTLAQEIAQLANLNCSDATQLLVALSREMGYSARFCHVYCKSGTGHIYAEVKGRELGTSWIRMDLAAAMSVGSKYPIGKTWCPDVPVSTYNDPWLETDDGKT